MTSCVITDLGTTHSTVSQEVADQAYKLGVNIMYYAFTQYYHRHYEQ